MSHERWLRCADEKFWYIINFAKPSRKLLKICIFMGRKYFLPRASAHLIIFLTVSISIRQLWFALCFVNSHRKMIAVIIFICLIYVIFCHFCSSVEYMSYQSLIETLVFRLEWGLKQVCMTSGSRDIKITHFLLF